MTDEPEVTRVELPEEHPAIAPLNFLLGRWRGTGKGDYPTIKSFDFAQEVTFSHVGKPYVIYTSRTWRLQTDDSGELTRDEHGAPVRLEPLAPRPDSGGRSRMARSRCCSVIPPGSPRSTWASSGA